MKTQKNYQIVQGKDAEGRKAYGISVRHRPSGLFQEPREFNLYSQKAAKEAIILMNK